MRSFHRKAAAILTIAALGFGAMAFAQTYPAKPVRLIVPYPPGGGTDLFARTVGAKLSEQLGQQIIVENRPGAATIIAAEATAKAAPDGYTLLIADSPTVAINPSLYSKLPYDPQKSFAPVSLTARYAMVLVVNPSAIKVNSVRELIEQAKKSPDKIDYASVGPGTTHHLAMELFKQQAGVALNHVPYKGSAPAVQDLLGGQIPVMFLDLASAAPHIKAGKLKVLGVASQKRLAAMPDVPTVAESGLPIFEAWAWQGLVAPAGTPKEVIAKLNAEYAKAVSDNSVRQKLLDAGIEPVTSTPDELSAYIKSETAKWAKVIKDAGIKVE